MNVALRLVCTLGPMALGQIFLHATGPVIYFYGFLAAGCFIPFLPLRYRIFFTPVYFCLGAFAGFTLIIIQPLSAFLVWFDLVALGAMRGPVSAVFVYLVGYLSLIAVFGLGPGRRVESLVRLVFVNLLVVFIILRLWYLAVLAGLLVPVLVAASLRRQEALRYPWRGMASVALLLLAAALLTLVSPFGRPPSGIYIIDRYLSGFLRAAVFRVLPDFPFLYGFSGYGQGFSEERLGNRPLLSERPLFAVEGRAGSTHYLRVKAYDSFTGNGWALSQAHPEAGAGGTLAANQQGPVILKLRLLTDYYPQVPQTLGATAVLPGRSGEGLRYKGGRNTGLSLARPLLYGEQLNLVGDPRSETGGQPASDTSSALDAGLADSMDLYLAVPEGISPEIRVLAAMVLGDSESELGAALARVLGEGFTYSLDVQDYPDRRGRLAGAKQSELGEGSRPDNSVANDFLHHFLTESRTGYCVHFASAAVILARLAGIPSRYVSGFLVTIPRPEGDALAAGSGGLARGEVSGLHSHAWAELWFPSTGWTSFEATPVLRQRSPLSEEGSGTLSSQDEYTLRQLAAIRSGRIGPSESDSPLASETWLIPYPALILLAGVAAVLACIVVFRLFWAVKRNSGGWLRWWSAARISLWFDRAVFRWFGREDADTFRRKAHRIVQLAGFLGVPRPEQCGWLAWERDVRELLTPAGFSQNSGHPGSFDLGIFRKIFFGCEEPVHEDFVQADTIATALRFRARETGNRLSEV